jgi:hypothetical protein
MSWWTNLQRTFGFAADPAPQRKLNDTQLEIQLDATIAKVNALGQHLETALVRSDGTLQDGLIRTRMLHSEVRLALNSLSSSTTSDTIYRMSAAATNGPTQTAIVLTGAQTLDGTALVDGDRALLHDQVDPINNGLWIVRAGAWERPTDMPAGQGAGTGWRILVETGTVYAGTAWGVATSGVTGTDPVAFVQIDGPGLVDTARIEDDAVTAAKIADIIATGSTHARSLGDRFGDVINVRDFGAVGDGVADDTAAIQAAVDLIGSGDSLFFPQGVYKLTARILITKTNVTVFGIGEGSKIVQSSLIGQDTLRLSGCTDTVVTGMHVVGNGMLSGVGIRLDACTRCAVERCHISNTRYGGVHLDGLTTQNVDCKVASCVFTDSPVTDLDVHTTSGAAVQSFGSFTGIVIENNIINDGNTYGVRVTMGQETDVGDGVVIAGNIIRNARGYGITVYRGDVTSAVFKGASIIGNFVKDTTGNVADAVYGNTYGTGIYVQSVDMTSVIGNVIDGANSGTTETLLTRAGIGVANATAVVISGNIVRNCTFHGIEIKDPDGYGDEEGASQINGNIIDRPGLDGIFAHRLSSGVTIANNTVMAPGRRGIAVDGAGTPVNGASVNNNTIRAPVNGGVYARNFRGFVSSNTITDSETYGIYLEGFSGVCNQNYMFFIGARGIHFVSAHSADVLVRIQDNEIVVPHTGLMLEAECVDDNNSIITPLSVDRAGTYGAMWRTLADDAEPSVLGGKLFKAGGSTAITNFINGQVGQTVSLRFDANTPVITHGATTIRLHGSANFSPATGDTITLTSFEVGKWDEVGRMVR